MAKLAEYSQWFDANWMKQRERALKEGFDTLPRRDQVLVAVGFLMDSMVGDGVWAIVDGIAEGNDEGLTAKMPTALDEIGFTDGAAHVRHIIRLREGAVVSDEHEDQEDPTRDEALDHWDAIGKLFGKKAPNGERLMLTQLYDWYHAQLA